MIIQISIGVLLLAAGVFVWKKGREGQLWANHAQPIVAVVVLGFALYMAVNSIWGGTPTRDLLSGDLDSARTVGREAGQYIAKAGSGQRVAVVTYPEAVEEQVLVARYQTQQAFIDAMQSAAGGSITSLQRIPLPMPEPANPEAMHMGVPTPTLSRSRMRQIFKQQSDADLIILAAGLPLNMETGKVKRPDGPGVVLWTNRAQQLAEAVRGGLFAWGVAERSWREANETGEPRFYLVTPDNAASVGQ
jgi:hypothetical protein